MLMQTALLILHVRGGRTQIAHDKEHMCRTTRPPPQPANPAHNKTASPASHTRTHLHVALCRPHRFPRLGSVMLCLLPPVLHLCVPRLGVCEVGSQVVELLGGVLQGGRGAQVGRQVGRRVQRREIRLRVRLGVPAGKLSGMYDGRRMG